MQLAVLPALLLAQYVVLTYYSSLGTDPAEATVAAEPRLPPDPTATVLDIFHPFSVGASIQPELERQSRRFERLNPEYRVHWTWGGSESVRQLRARLNAGDPPDAALSNDAFLIAMAREGLAQPLDAYLEGASHEGDGRWKDAFWPGLLANSFVDNGAAGPGYYGIPWSAHVSGIYYNRGLFERHGFAVPGTWEQLVELCERIQQQADMACFEADNFDGYNARLFLYLATRTVGRGQLYDTAMNRPGTSWRDPGFEWVASESQRFVRRFYTRGWEGNRWPVGQMDWANEGAAMILMPTWLPSELRDVKAEGFRMDLFAFPAVGGAGGDARVSEVKYNGWFLPRGARQPEGAIRLIRFLSSREAQAENAEAGSLPPAVRGVPLPEGVEGARDILEGDRAMPFAAGLDADAAGWLRKVFYPLNDELLLGQLTPQEFVDRLQQEHDEFYASREVAR
jgi:raffinose/stachyose/melibiose transport system substrate-binding protein